MTISIDCVTNDGVGESVFGQQDVILSGDSNRCLSEQIDAINFRLRTSPIGYVSDYHVAGDPTLLIILQGSLRLMLPSGESCSYQSGDMFIAEDYLQANCDFVAGLHGHKAEVIGNQELRAIHLKLRRR